jgi:superfamily II RNA helicase
MTKTTEELQELLQEIRHKPWSVIYKEKRGD